MRVQTSGRSCHRPAGSDRKVGTCSRSALASDFAANLKSSCSCIWLSSISWLSFWIMMSLNVWI